MRWLIDGYNVIRRDPGLGSEERARGLQAGRTALLRLVAGVARRSSDRFTVVFDGAQPWGRDPAAGQIEVLFSRPPRTADDVLVDLARRAGGGGAVLVSSDRAVQSAARRAGCPVVGAEAFLDAAAGGSSGDDDDDDDEEEDGDAGAPPPRRGNPYRASKEEREARRALDRLRRLPR
jgi:predicted RNA-binding protein with PIN domain